MDKQIKIKKASSAFDKIMLEYINRPWYEKVYTSIRIFLLMARSSARYYFMKFPKNIDAKNDVVTDIKDDIEFGYDVEMIYNKIMNGSYGNEPIDKKFNHFENEGIDWKSFLKRKKVVNSAKTSEWQLCPKCLGDGNLGRYNSPPFASSTALPTCDVCQGAKIFVKPIVSDLSSDHNNVPRSY